MTHFHIGFFEFLTWLLYYMLAKAIFLYFNVEARRNRWHVPAAVAGLFS